MYKNLLEKCGNRKIQIANDFKIPFNENLRGIYHYVFINNEMIVIDRILAKTNRLFHNSIAENQDVDASGHINITNDKIVIDNYSGHYKPKKEALNLFYNFFKHKDSFIERKRYIEKKKEVYQLTLIK